MNRIIIKLLKIFTWFTQTYVVIQTTTHTAHKIMHKSDKISLRELGEPLCYVNKSSIRTIPKRFTLVNFKAYLLPYDSIVVIRLEIIL